MHEKITRLRQERAQKIAEMRGILDDKDVLTAEQAQEYDRREAELGEMDEMIARLEKMAGLAAEPDFSEARSIAAGDREGTDFSDAPAGEERADGRMSMDLFDRFLRSKGQDVEARASMLVGSSTAGGSWVPQEWSDKLVESLVLMTALFDVADVIDTSNGVPININTDVTDEAIAAIAEEGSYTNPNPTTGTVQLGAYKYGALVKVSEELLADSSVDIAARIQRKAGRFLGNQIGAVLAVGSGSSAPQGISKCTVGVTAASTTATTADEVFDTQHSLLAPYRKNAAWFVNDTWLKGVRKLKSTTNDYLLQPGLAAGQPDTLLGSPVYIEQLDAPATGKVVAVYGDPQAYTVRRTPLTITVLRERFADVGDIGFKVNTRIDAKITDSVGLRSLKQA